MGQTEVRPNRRPVFGHVFGPTGSNTRARARGSRGLTKARESRGLAEGSRDEGSRSDVPDEGIREGYPRANRGSRGDGGQGEGARGAGARGGDQGERNWVAEAVGGGGRNWLKYYVDRLTSSASSSFSSFGSSGSKATATMTMVARGAVGANEGDAEANRRGEPRGHRSKRGRESEGHRSERREGEGSGDWP